MLLASWTEGRDSAQQLAVPRMCLAQMAAGLMFGDVASGLPDLLWASVGLSCHRAALVNLSLPVKKEFTGR